MRDVDKGELLDKCQHFIINNDDEQMVRVLIDDARMTADSYEEEYDVYLAYIKVLEEYVDMTLAGQFRHTMIDYWESQNGHA